MAFNILLEAYWVAVYGFILKRCKNPYDAEDITIQTFSKAFEKLDLYKEGHKFQNWLFVIAKHIHIDQNRNKSTYINQSTCSIQEIDTEQILLTQQQNPTPEDLLIHAQNLDTLLEEIKKLSIADQKIIHLRYFKQLKYKEIAILINQPLDTVRIRLFRAKKKLALLIKQR